MDEEHIKLLRNDFPILNTEIKKKRIAYLDNGATTQKPLQVIDAITHYYKKENANVHRGIYSLSEISTERYEEAHRTVGRFIGAKEHEVVFTRGTTESLNLLSYTLPSILDRSKGRDEVIVTEIEHHSNLVPWQQLCKREGMKLRVVKIDDDFMIDMDDFNDVLSERTALVCVGHISNVTGTLHDVKTICEESRKVGALSVIDGAQGAGHTRVDVTEIGCDFYAGSSHKMCGPMGMGFLFGRERLLRMMKPFHFGGDMIMKVTYEGATWNELPMKFEAGTPNVSGAVGLSEAVRYLESVGMENIERWEHTLMNYAVNTVGSIDGVRMFLPPKQSRTGILSFTLDGVHPHDLAPVLNDAGVCIRAGHHCAMPFMKKLGIPGTNRVSLYLYNTRDDVDRLVVAIEKARSILK